MAEQTSVRRHHVIIPYTVEESAIDDMGILYYGHYSQFYDLARKFLFREYGYPNMYAWAEEGWTMPIIRYSTRIFRMARKGDELRLVSWVHAQKGVRLVMALEVWSKDGSEQVAMGYCEGCFIDAKTYRPVKPSLDWKLIRGLREEEAQKDEDDGEFEELIIRPPVNVMDPDNKDPDKY